jgi:hypothetical protein
MYVIKLVVGPWEKTFKCSKKEKVTGALAFGTKEEALAFGRWIAEHAERLRGEVRDGDRYIRKLEEGSNERTRS